MPILAQFILALAYFIVGCVLSIPYTYIANGNMDNFMLTAWIAPVGALVLFITHAVGRATSRCRSFLARKSGGWFFWSVVTWFCLPIVLNGVSLLLRKLGLYSTSHYVFEYRYFSIVAVPFFLIIYGMIMNGVGSFLEWLNRSTKL